MKEKGLPLLFLLLHILLPSDYASTFRGALAL